MRSTVKRILLTAVGAIVLVVAAAAVASSAPGDEPTTASTSTPAANKREVVQRCREAYRTNPDAAPSPECQAMRDQQQGKREAVQRCREEHRANPDAAPSPECQAMRERLQQRKQRSGPGQGPVKGDGLLGRAVHGALIVQSKDGQFENVAVDRGKVASADATSITLDRPDGKTVTLKINGDTKFRGVDSADTVREGDPALVVSKDGTAVTVAQRKAGERKAG